MNSRAPKVRLIRRFNVAESAIISEGIIDVNYTGKGGENKAVRQCVFVKADLQKKTEWNVRIPSIRILPIEKGVNSSN